MNAVRNAWVRAALLFALATPLYFLIAAFGTKFGLLDWRIGFGLMTFQLGGIVLMGVAALAFIGLILALTVPPRGLGWRSALIALIIPAVGLGFALYVRQNAVTIPPIHDITTDFVDPPSFSEDVVAARGRVGGGNPLDPDARVPEDPRFGEWSGMRVQDIQRNEYRDILPIRTQQSPDQAFDAALEATRAIGLNIGVQDRADGRIEATAQSFWYGFVDDFVVRIRSAPSGGGAVVDVRSVSRVGLSDLGANAKRVRAFTEELNERLAR